MDEQIRKQFESGYEVALYQSLVGASSYCFVATFYGDEDHKRHFEAVRISEPMLIRFQPLSSDQAIQNAVASLDAQEAQLRVDLEIAVTRIREQKASLLAITFQPEAVS